MITSPISLPEIYCADKKYIFDETVTFSQIGKRIYNFDVSHE